MLDDLLENKDAQTQTYNPSQIEKNGDIKAYSKKTKNLKEKNKYE